jgi:hypothetical protein
MFLQDMYSSPFRFILGKIIFRKNYSAIKQTWIENILKKGKVNFKFNIKLIILMDHYGQSLQFLNKHT